MVEAILRSLHEVDGVQASLVLNANAELLAHRAHAVFPVALLHDAGRAIGAAVDSLQLVHEDWELVSADFLEGKLLVQSLAEANAPRGPAAVLALLADARLNPSFASVAIRVAAGRLKAVLAAPLAHATQVSAARTRKQTPDGSSSATLPALPSSSAAQPSLPPSDSTLGPWLSACTKALAGSVGPMAKVFVKEALARLPYGQPVTRAAAATALLQLEAHIADPDERALFRKVVGQG